MTDPLSLSIAGFKLIKIGVKVTESLAKLYGYYKDLDADVAHVMDNIESLTKSFQYVSSALQGRRFQQNERGMIDDIEFRIHTCGKPIQELKDLCEKLKTTSVSGTRSTIKQFGCLAAYPFKKSTMKTLDELICEIRDNLSLLLQALAHSDNQRMREEIDKVKSLVEMAGGSAIQSRIRRWLHAPDATLNYHAACEKSHAGTGLWLINDERYRKWLKNNNSFLWLNGFAGCGKSVLCSTAIRNVSRQKSVHQGVGVGFFYFVFNDDIKQDEFGMIRALLIQLSNQLAGAQDDLTQLYQKYGSGMPPVGVLMTSLQAVIQRFDQVYIFLDALDESPGLGRRNKVLDAIGTMRSWSLPAVHLLVTSRDERDIRESLQTTKIEEVALKEEHVNQDINNYITWRLHTDQTLKHLHRYHNRIRQSLIEGAHGLFRWVECQFDSLRRCPRSRALIDRCLNTLPRGLDETYDRMLNNIDDILIPEARRILNFLCFSARPLFSTELIDAIAVDLEEPPGLNPQRRLEDVEDIQRICPGLVDFDVQKDGTKVLRIAHYSVQEFLKSDRNKSHHLGLSKNSANAEIANVCLRYLLEPGFSEKDVNAETLREFPLAEYATLFWDHHHKSAGSMTPQLDEIVLWVFQNRHDFLHTYISLIKMVGEYENHIDEDRTLVYYASLLGLGGVLDRLLEHCQDDSDSGSLITAQAKAHGDALKAASEGGHVNIVKTLIGRGIDVNIRDSNFRSPLNAASAKGHVGVVRTLIEAGADIHARDHRNDFCADALQAASEKGHADVVELLLQKGADVNGRDEASVHGVSSLEWACYWGHAGVVQALIDGGADVNAAGYFGSALQVAAKEGDENIVRMLIKAKPDMKRHGGEALEEAMTYHRSEIIDMLKEAGAEESDKYGSGLPSCEESWVPTEENPW